MYVEAAAGNNGRQPGWSSTAVGPNFDWAGGKMTSVIGRIKTAPVGCAGSSALHRKDENWGIVAVIWLLPQTKLSSLASSRSVNKLLSPLGLIMRLIGGQLGSAASALIDGVLRRGTSNWNHQDTNRQFYLSGLVHRPTTTV